MRPAGNSGVRRLSRRLALLALPVALLAAGPASAATFTPTTTADGNTATLGGGGINAPFDSPNPPPVTAIADSLIANNTVSGGVGNGQGGGAALFGNTAIQNTTITGNRVSNPGTNEGGGLVVARQ